MPSSKLVIGLTGGIGSGKTAAANIFKALGINIVDADIAARKVVEPGHGALKQLVEHFGTIILTKGSGNKDVLNRQALRSIVFSNPEQLTWLNNFMHPLIRDWMDDETTKATSQYVIKVIPLLTESALKQQVDRILVIDVPLDTQLERVAKRDHCTPEEVEQITLNQSTREKRLSFADDVISNNSSLEDLELAVKKMHLNYLELARL